MKSTHIILAGLLAALPLHAATIISGDPQAGGIGYQWQATFSANDSGSFSSHVGAWSWEDEGIFEEGEPAVGWTHTSNWVAVTLTETSYVTIRLESNALVPFTGSGNIGGFAPTDNFYPSFTLWSGWDNDGEDNHTYNNHGNVDWAEDITFIGLKENNTEHFAEATFLLTAGNYSLVLGSNAPSESNPPRQGYLATITTIPEPSTALLGFIALGAMSLRRRR